MPDPVTLEIDYVEPRSRLPNFFRLLLAIPLPSFAYFAIVLFFVAVAAGSSSSHRALAGGHLRLRRPTPAR